MPRAALSLSPALHTRAQRNAQWHSGACLEPPAPLTGTGGTLSPRRQCSCSRNQPCTARPASSRSSRRPTPSWAALQGRLRWLLPSLVNGMSVCPSTTNTEGRTTVSSMPAPMRPQDARAARHVWVSPAGGNHNCPTLLGFAHRRQARPWVPGLPLELGFSPSPFPLALLFFLSPTPCRPHLTLTHTVSHTFQRPLKM